MPKDETYTFLYCSASKGIIRHFNQKIGYGYLKIFYSRYWIRSSNSSFYQSSPQINYRYDSFFYLNCYPSRVNSKKLSNIEVISSYFMGLYVINI